MKEYKTVIKVEKEDILYLLGNGGYRKTEENVEKVIKEIELWSHEIAEDIIVRAIKTIHNR